MEEKWLKLAEQFRGMAQLCQAFAKSVESQPNTKKKEEQPITL